MPKINNFYNGEIYRSITVNAFNPNLKKLYNQVSLIQAETKQRYRNNQAGIDIAISPTNYLELLQKGENLVYDQQAPLIDLEIAIKVNTAKMPVEVLAKLVKTNTQAEVDNGRSTGKNARCLVEMFTTRKEYQQKINLKAQGQIDFAKFKCEAQSCGRTNAHRTTLYAVIDKKSNKIKYYGSSCINKVDGYGTVEYLQHLVDTLNKFVDTLDKVKNKFADGIKVNEILTNTVNAYTQNKNSKFYYQNSFYSSEEISDIAKTNQTLKDKVKNNLPPIMIKNLKNGKQTGLRIVNSSFMRLVTSKAQKTIKNIDVDSFIQYLKRSRAIGSARSNGKTLIQALEADGKARAITATSMRNLFLTNLKNYHLEMIFKSIEEISDEKMKRFFTDNLKRSGIELVDFEVSKDDIDLIINCGRTLIQEIVAIKRKKAKSIQTKDIIEKEIIKHKICLQLENCIKKGENDYQYDLKLTEGYYSQRENSISQKMILNNKIIELTKNNFEGKKVELSDSDYSILQIVLDDKAIENKIQEYLDWFDNLVSFIRNDYQNAQESQNATAVKSLITDCQKVFNDLPLVTDKKVFFASAKNLCDKNNIEMITAKYKDIINNSVSGDTGLISNVDSYYLSGIIKEIKISISEDFLNSQFPVFNDDINNEDLQIAYEKMLKTVVRKKKGIPLVFEIFSKRIKTNIEKKRVFNSYLGYFDVFEQLQLIDKETNKIVGTMRADDVSEFKEYQDNIQKSIINALVKAFKREFTFENYLKYKSMDDEEKVESFLKDLSEKQQYLGNVRMNRR